MPKRLVPLEIHERDHAAIIHRLEHRRHTHAERLFARLFDQRLVRRDPGIDALRFRMHDVDRAPSIWCERDWYATLTMIRRRMALDVFMWSGHVASMYTQRPEDRQWTRGGLLSDR